MNALDLIELLRRKEELEGLENFKGLIAIIEISPLVEGIGDSRSSIRFVNVSLPEIFVCSEILRETLNVSIERSMEKAVEKCVEALKHDSDTNISVA